MKIKIYLFRLTGAAAAFSLSLGGYTVWRYVKSPFVKTQTALPDARQISSPVAAERIRIAVEPYLPKKAVELPFDPEGYYYLTGEIPKGFEDFENFRVINKDYATEDENAYGKLIAPRGAAATTTKEFNFTSIGIGGGQIQFETARAKGISYSFDGRFVETRNFLDLEFEAVEKVLEGRLVKKRSGKIIAARDVQFGWYLEPGCGC